MPEQPCNLIITVERFYSVISVPSVVKILVPFQFATLNLLPQPGQLTRQFFGALASGVSVHFRWQ